MCWYSQVCSPTFCWKSWLCFDICIRVFEREFYVFNESKLLLTSSHFFLDHCLTVVFIIHFMNYYRKYIKITLCNSAPKQRNKFSFNKYGINMKFLWSISLYKKSTSCSVMSYWHILNLIFSSSHSNWCFCNYMVILSCLPSL